jgi:glycogen(starch) synthase
VDSLPPELARADVLLVPSRSEGLGRVVVEAALAGTPAVACNVGGLGETMIDGRTGLLVRDFESEGERSRIAALLGDAARRRAMAAAAREFCRERFDPRRAAERTLHVYRTVLAGGAGAAEQAATAAAQQGAPCPK